MLASGSSTKPSAGPARRRQQTARKLCSGEGSGRVVPDGRMGRLVAWGSSRAEVDAKRFTPRPQARVPGEVVYGSTAVRAAAVQSRASNQAREVCEGITTRERSVLGIHRRRRLREAHRARGPAGGRKLGRDRTASSKAIAGRGRDMDGRVVVKRVPAPIGRSRVHVEKETCQANPTASKHNCKQEQLFVFPRDTGCVCFASTVAMHTGEAAFPSARQGDGPASRE